MRPSVDQLKISKCTSEEFSEIRFAVFMQFETAPRSEHAAILEQQLKAQNQRLEAIEFDDAWHAPMIDNRDDDDDL